MDFVKVTQVLKESHQPNYRLKQIRQAYFKDLITDWTQITTVPTDLLNSLSKIPWDSVVPVKVLNNRDRTSYKGLFQLADSNFIESVLMIYDGRVTVCVSSQVGCNLGCGFCATGRGGFSRNLTGAEIVDQVVFWSRFVKKLNGRVSNLVFMGMGEPFNNWANVWEAIQILNGRDGLNIAQRKISVSTAGVVPGIKEFTRLNIQINLAISLHAPNDELRSAMMPINRLYKIKELMAACVDYVKKTNRKVFFEYVMINNQNDSVSLANQLAELMSQSHLFHVNLIPLNPIDADFHASSRENLKDFAEVLRARKISYTIRQNLGREIEAACGQLTLKHVANPQTALKQSRLLKIGK